MGIELEKAVELILDSVSACGETEEAGLDGLSGRVCAENVYAPTDNPPFDRSPLDGYAFFHEDSRGARRDNPAVLRVVEEVFAGQFPKLTVERGSATRIMTGAPIPEGADCVIRQEDTDYGMESVEIYKELSAYDNYCYRGDDVRQGSLLAREGEKLNFVHAGVFAGMGIDTVRVFRKIKVLILTTGDELYPVSSPELAPGKIYESNSYLLSARLGELGIQNPEVCRCVDDIEAITQCIKQKIEEVDMVITTGGVSVGKKDMMHLVIERLQAEKLFWGINLKPGSPALFSVYQKKPVLSLSGNPFAAGVTFELLARPALAKMSRNPGLNLIKFDGVMACGFHKKSPSRRFIRAVERDGKVYLPDGQHSSGALFSMLGCNCLIDIEAGSTGLIEGEKVRLLRL